MSSPMIDPAAAHALIAEGALALDATWTMPGAPQTGRALFEAGHIPGARYFDIDAIAAPGGVSPHMAPPAAVLAAALREMGYADHQPVLVYDQNRFFASARVWWTLLGAGVGPVFVLDGGLDAWRGAGLAVAEGDPPAPARGAPPVTALDNLWAVDRAAVAEASRTGGRRILDARARERFSGEAAEPRAHLPSGHVPGARCLPWQEVVDDSGRMRSPDAIRAAFAHAGVAGETPLIFMCGSGVSAAVLHLAAHIADFEHLALYDGSWTEWASDPDAPVATGTDGAGAP